MADQSLNSTLTDNIYHYLREEILYLRLEPGVRLSEAGLARQFNCSRIPVREAVQKLVSEGALEVIPQKGSFVTQIDLAQMEKIRYIREVLETRIVLDDFDKGILTPIIPILESMIKRQEVLMAVGDFNQVFTLDSDFHFMFYSIDRKDYVFDYAGMTEINFCRGRILTLQSEDKDNMIKQHHAIVEDIKKGDRAALEADLHHHFVNVNDIIKLREFKTKKGENFFRDIETVDLPVS